MSAGDGDAQKDASQAGAAGEAGGADSEQVLARLLGRSRKDKEAVAREKDFKFWKTQPVPALDDTSEEEGPIEVKTVDEVRKEPRKLPGAFQWSDIDVADDAQLDEVYELLADHYVEDDDNMFRFNYSKEFLRWALTPPGFHADWHIGVRQVSNGKLRAFITGIPVTVDAYGSEGIRMAEINFLCVHKKLRAKRLAPVLIKEITRRVNLCDMWQAVYTAGAVLPRPVCRSRYWHRSLHPRKLIDIGFSHLPPRTAMSTMVKLYRLPEAPRTPGFRAMAEGDVSAVCALLNQFLAKFSLKAKFDEADVAHWLLPRPGVINTFVVENPDSGKVTDFGSFYHIPSAIIGNPNYDTFTAAYMFYYAASRTELKDMVKDLMIEARNANCDVFNCLDIMDNKTFLKDLKFAVGDGALQYYLYNWRCAPMEAESLGMVLL